jgi:hypothetical protein
MIGQLQMWDDELARLKYEAARIEANARVEYELRLRALERCNRDVFRRYADLALSDEDQWDEKRVALDAAAFRMTQALEEFAPQPA